MHRISGKTGGGGAVSGGSSGHGPRKFNRSSKRRTPNDSDAVTIDWGKPPEIILGEILQNISRKSDQNNLLLTKTYILSHLNAFIKLLKSCRQLASAATSISDSKVSFRDYDILLCLRTTLLHESPDVRAGTLRALRYHLRTKVQLKLFLSLNLHYLVCRSLDFVLDNSIERVQALRLVRHILPIDPMSFPLALARCLCSIANESVLEKEVLLRSSWATIAELSIVNPKIAAQSGCLSILMKCTLNSSMVSSNIQEPSNARGHQPNIVLNSNPLGPSNGSLNIPQTNLSISESVLVSFLHLYNLPQTRKLLEPNGQDLYFFISVFTDMYSFIHASKVITQNQNRYCDPFQPGDDDNENKNPRMKKVQIAPTTASKENFACYETRTLKYNACKNSLLVILRSWPGLFIMCRSRLGQKENNAALQRALSKENIDNYSEIYLKTWQQNIKTWKDSIQFFGINDHTPSKGAQMVGDIDSALGDEQDTTTSYFTSTDYGHLNPLESLIGVLHLPYPEVHRHLLELLFELFGMKTPEFNECFDEMIVTRYHDLSGQSSQKMGEIFDRNLIPEEWQLYEGFVCKEAEHVLQSRAKSRLNFINNYYALLLQSLVEFGLFEGLVSVVIESCDCAAVNAGIVLLAELLHLSGRLLPSSNYAHRCQSLPTLIAASISNCKERKNRAMMTITQIDHIYSLKKRARKPSSLFLEQQILFHEPKKPTIISNFSHMPPRKRTNPEDNTHALIKASHVLKKTNFREWNWHIVIDIFKNPSDSMLKLEEKDTHRAFLKKMCDFYLPSRRLFSLISKSSSTTVLDTTSAADTSMNSSTLSRNGPYYVENPKLICIAAVYFVDFLLTADETRASEVIEIFIRDLDLSMKNIATKSPSMDEPLLPSKLMSNLSSHYFLLLGRFTHSQVGRRWLEQTHIYQYFLDLISLATNDVYMKLIVSSLDYSEPHFARTLLSKVLSTTPESSRIYATQYLRVLLRIGLSNFHEWAIDLLVTQLYDRCPAVSLTALDILDEACCTDSQCLEKLISHRPSVVHLGDFGIVFLSRFLSHPTGLTYFKESNLLEHEISRWQNLFVAKYVKIVEDLLNECFSSHQRSEYGTYGRRSDIRQFPNTKHVSLTNFVPSHLYGQLAKTEAGIQVLKQYQIVEKTVEMLAKSLVETCDSCFTDQLRESDVLRLKASLWSIGHIASTEAGLGLVQSQPERVLAWIVNLARQSQILSLRLTCFYVLSLVAATNRGAKLICDYGWVALTHKPDEDFPINQAEYEEFYYNVRPRFASDPDQEILNTARLVSVPGADLLGADNLFPRSIFLRTSSQSSLSSSYSNENNNNNNVKKKTTFTISPSSSSTSIFSNSSAGNLNTSAVLLASTKASNLHRPRSSSDAPISSQKTLLVHQPILEAQSAETNNDSGIVEASVDEGGTMARFKTDLESERSRKISAPCLNAPKTQVNNVANSSRSTSFAEYSSTSSNGRHEMMKIDRSVSFSPETIELEQRERMGRKLERQVSSNRQFSAILSQQLDDPYPSSVDAHGYAQLRAIQKRRVNSISGNMFNSNLSSAALDEFGKQRTRSSSGKSHDEVDTPEIMVSSSDVYFTVGAQSNCSMKKEDLLKVPSLGSFFIDENGSIARNLQRTFSHSSKTSYQSNISTETFSEVGSDRFTVTPAKLVEDDGFMCLALPSNLSLLFYLEDEKQLKFYDYKWNSRKSSLSTAEDGEGSHLRRHLKHRCIFCCDEIVTEELSANSQSVQENPQQQLQSDGQEFQYEIVELVNDLSVFMLSKQAEQRLLSLKQKYPILFESHCLYSDVCHRMEQVNLKCNSRRFLQELFIDINSNSFQQKAEFTLKQRSTAVSNSGVEQNSTESNTLAIPIIY